MSHMRYGKVEIDVEALLKKYLGDGAMLDRIIDDSSPTTITVVIKSLEHLMPEGSRDYLDPNMPKMRMEITEHYRTVEFKSDEH